MRYLVAALCAVLISPILSQAPTAPEPSEGRLALGSARRLVPQESWPALEAALKATACAVAGGAEIRTPALALVDYSISSTRPRLWVLNMHRQAVLFHELVAHGKNSGFDLPTSFSNRVGSLQSSLGLYVTGETYQGQNGLSLRLHGLDEGFNDNSFERAIVMHGANYVNPVSAVRNGRLGRSWGCPAVRRKVTKPILDSLAAGSTLFVYSKDEKWRREPALLHCDAEPEAALEFFTSMSDWEAGFGQLPAD